MTPSHPDLSSRPYAFLQTFEALLQTWASPSHLPLERHKEQPNDCALEEKGSNPNNPNDPNTHDRPGIATQYFRLQFRLPQQFRRDAGREMMAYSIVRRW